MPRVQAPARRELWDFIDIAIDGIRAAKGGALDRFGIIEAFQIQLLFGCGATTLLPEGLPGPDVGPEHFAGIGLDPGMMVQHTAQTEELDMAQPAAEIEDKSVARIDVFDWIGQARAKNKNPSLNGRCNKQLFIPRQPLDPGTGFGIMETQCRLNRKESVALNRQPAAWSTKRARPFQGAERIWFSLNGQLNTSGSPDNQSNDANADA